MARFVKVRGRQGVLVSNPWAIDASPRRYAGQQLKPLDPNLKLDPTMSVCDHYEPCDEVMAYHGDLVRAKDEGAFETFGMCDAKNHEEALRGFADMKRNLGGAK